MKSGFFASKFTNSFVKTICMVAIEETLIDACTMNSTQYSMLDTQCSMFYILWSMLYTRC